jgi:hypothetical protein
VGAERVSQARKLAFRRRNRLRKNLDPNDYEGSSSWGDTADGSVSLDGGSSTRQPFDEEEFLDDGEVSQPSIASSIDTRTFVQCLRSAVIGAPAVVALRCAALLEKCGGAVLCVCSCCDEGMGGCACVRSLVQQGEGGGDREEESMGESGRSVASSGKTSQRSSSNWEAPGAPPSLKRSKTKPKVMRRVPFQASVRERGCEGEMVVC